MLNQQEIHNLKVAQIQLSMLLGRDEKTDKPFQDTIQELGVIIAKLENPPLRKIPFFNKALFNKLEGKSFIELESLVRPLEVTWDQFLFIAAAHRLGKWDHSVPVVQHLLGIDVLYLPRFLAQCGEEDAFYWEALGLISHKVEAPDER